MNSTSSKEKTLRQIRWLIWTYFWLLLFEGALRKWVVPQLSNPLLIIRDPVVIVIYLLAIRARVFPTNGWIWALFITGGLSVAATFFVLWPYLGPSRIALVAGYGFRSDFLHLPLIFVMPAVLRAADVKRFGWWTLLIMVPMAVLMVGQFNASPDAFLNRTAGGEGEMMTSALGKVRTAATFSFVVGVVSYFAMSTAFLIWAALRRDVYPNWLLFASGAALAIGTAVSGSRSVVAACAIVVSSLVVILVLRPAAINRFGQTLLVTVVLGWLVMQTPIFKEGFNVLSTRFNEVAEASETSIGAGAAERIFGLFTDSFTAMAKAPFLGYGLGVGTNGGARFLTGRAMFLLSEGEWSRIFLESGALLGGAFVLWRCGIVLKIGALSLRSVKAGNVLPLLLFSSCFMAMLNGQFGQPTMLGFACFTTGMALAARRDEASELAIAAAVPNQVGPRVARRSAYAERLHGPVAPQLHGNGASNGAPAGPVNRATPEDQA